jgi:hypothetical protein
MPVESGPALRVRALHPPRARAASAFACALAVQLGAPAARAQDKSACVAAHEAAQEQRRAGSMRAARTSLDVCARESCPALVRRDCAGWLDEVAAATPSIIVEVRDVAGRETLDVVLLVDGEQVAERLDGRAIDIDPGEHTVGVRARDGKVLEEKVVLREGERRRRVALTFAPPAAPPTLPVAPSPAPLPPSPSPSPWAWVLGGVALAGAGSFATFAVLGRGEQDDLELCRPDCDPGALDPMRRDYLVADISLVVAVLAAAGSTVLFLSTPGPAAPPAARAVARRGPFAGPGPGFRF